MQSRTYLLLAFLLSSLPLSAWWENGHRTTARLAAFYLTDAARARLAVIMGVPNTPEAVADGLAAGSTWPDEIKKDRPETQSWHYIDLALQDKPSDIPERCPDQNCVTARIDLFTNQLIKDKAASDPTIDRDALRFLVHFMGDIHQPLHASSDADLGGNCEPLTEPYQKAKNLHALWDGPLVDNLNSDDRALAADLKNELDFFGNHRRKSMAKGNVDDWAWESHKVAERFIYRRLNIPTEPVEFPASCKVAPEEIVNDKIEVDTAYLNQTKAIVRMQLERAGLRLARLLNSIE